MLKRKQKSYEYERRGEEEEAEEKRRGGGEGKPLWSSLCISRRKDLHKPEVPCLQNPNEIPHTYLPPKPMCRVPRTHMNGKGGTQRIKVIPLAS